MSWGLVFCGGVFVYLFFSIKLFLGFYSKFATWYQETNVSVKVFHRYFARRRVGVQKSISKSSCLFHIVKMSSIALYTCREKHNWNECVIYTVAPPAMPNMQFRRHDCGIAGSLGPGFP